MVQNRLVFVGGLHRSGTTLLADCLQQWPETSGFQATGVIEDEGQFLQSVYPTDNAHGGPGRFAFDPAAHLTEESGLASPDNAERLWSEWRRYWDCGRPVLVEKSPANLIRARFLQQLFPNSSFVFILRHPVATSIATYKWSGTGIYSLLHHWVAAHDIMRSDIAHLRNVMVISYEGLMAAPQQVLDRIANFLQLPGHGDCALRFDAGMNAKYGAMWRSVFLKSLDRGKPVPPVGAVHAHKESGWRTNWRRVIKSRLRTKLFGDERQLSMTTYEAQDAVAMFEHRVNAYGYSLVDLAGYRTYPLEEA